MDKQFFTNPTIKHYKDVSPLIKFFSKEDSIGSRFVDSGIQFNGMNLYFKRTMYDKFRPSYPAEIIDRLISTTKINSKSKLLEIGSGSGKATELLAPYKFDIFCVEPGEKL